MNWRLRLSAVALVSTLVIVATVAMISACANSGERSEKDAVLRVVQQGEAAILADRPEAVCRLLTTRARRNSLILDGIDMHPDGRPRPKPKTCAQAVGYMLDDQREFGALMALRPGGEYHATKIVSIGHGRAHVRKSNHMEIYLVKRNGEWLADYANFAPFDGSSGY